MSLPPHPSLSRRRGPIVLCILDGVGLGRGEEDDAVATARTPHLDRLLAAHPHCGLKAHGVAVGLPSDADIGNSEVGHNAMGAGRVFEQGASLVNHALAGPAWESDVWSALCGGKTLHLLGLVSGGNVHSHTDHLDLLIARAAADGVKRLRVHALTDGRDVPARSALTWITPLEESLAAHRAAGRDYRIASGGGRMIITMDRYEADWEMVARGWRCHVHGQGRAFASASSAIETMYAEDPKMDDQRLPPFVIVDDAGAPVGTIEDGDSVLLFNFRGDRAIEISRAFEDHELPQLDRGRRPDVYFAGMMQYDGDSFVPKRFLVAPPEIDRTVGEFLAAAGRRVLAVAETQKYGHVTYFYNGNRTGYIDGALERYVEVASDNRPFNQAPWMKAAEVTDAVLEGLAAGGYDHIRVNYANGDMVGHTGDLEATRISVEAVDLQLGRLLPAIERAGGVLLLTADHGNADEMWLRKGDRVLMDPHGEPLTRTAHTTNPVPFIVYDPLDQLEIAPVKDAGIASLGATVLALCGLAPPADYLPALVQARR
jgi:2,3-bisphosphoglycerate-independent phosphoglycerate mutase